jgi:hypothetical protein
MALSVMVCRSEGAGVETVLAMGSAVGHGAVPVFYDMSYTHWVNRRFVCMADRDYSLLAGDPAM